MTYTIKTVRYPYMAIDILTEALQRGVLTMGQFRNVLDRVSNRSYADGYLNYCLQTRILRPASNDSNSYLPTIRGRKLFLQAQQNHSAAVRTLLGSIPYYRYHAELNLTWLLLDSGFHHSNQAEIMWASIDRNIPWFRSDRFTEILTDLEINQSEIKTENDLNEIESKIRRITIRDPFIEWKTYRLWDEYLKFVNLSELTIANNLIAFLAEQKSNPVVVDLDLVDAQDLAQLLLLVLAQSEGLSVVGNERMRDVKKLKKLGFDIRSGDNSFFLATPVKFIFPSKLPVWRLSIYYLSEPVLTFLIKEFIELVNASAVEEPGQASITLDLKGFFRKVKEADGFSTVFAPTILSQNWDETASSSIEIWRDLPLWQADRSNFHDEIRELCKPSNNSAPSGEIRLTADQFGHLDSLDIFEQAKRSPHVYMFLMLLIDRDQSGVSPLLTGNHWSFGGMDLISTMDLLLRDIGYTVWDEWYSYDEGLRRNLGAQLVKLFQELNVANIQYNQLELTDDFSRLLQLDMAFIPNQTRLVRQRIRNALMNNSKKS
jgi:hypothetical protein